MAIGEEKRVPHFDYPKVKPSLGVAALQEPYPAVFLDLQGNILGANALAFWLGGGVKAGDPIPANRLLGKNTFSRRALNLHRIPAALNQEYYVKMSAIAKRMYETWRLPAFAEFINTLLADPQLASIYAAAPMYTQEEWEYPVFIMHPERIDELLEFYVNVYRLERESGFLVVYSPKGNTRQIIEEQYSQFLQSNEYFVCTDFEGIEQDKRRCLLQKATSYHDYYPYIIQDPLWYISGENEANRLLLGASVAGIHFFELFFSPALKDVMGPIQETTAPRALRYFDLFTLPYCHEGHELHEQYMQTIQRLTHIPAFNEFLDISRRWPITINPAVYENASNLSETPFYTCKVILPWRYSFDILLSFKSMVRFLYQSALVVPQDQHYYQVFLVPENYETEAALILLMLLSSAPEDGASNTRALLWLLALIKTICDRLALEDDAAWDYQEAFTRIRKEVETAFADSTRERVTSEIRRAIDELDNEGKVRKERLSALLDSYLLTCPHLDELRSVIAPFLQEVYAS